MEVSSHAPFAHWDVLASVDFTTIEAWTKSGLVTFYLLFVMEVATRRVHFAGSTANPDELWMLQIGNLSDAEDGFLRGKNCLLMDRDAFSKSRSLWGRYRLFSMAV